MTLMPSPVDLRIWFLSKALGWPGRKIASEVGVSQPTVVRKLAEMEEDPPTEADMQEFVSSGTPPKGFPALKARRGNVPILMLAYTGAVIIIALAVTLVLVSLAVTILTH
jgi:hypothetical protein